MNVTSEREELDASSLHYIFNFIKLRLRVTSVNKSKREECFRVALSYNPAVALKILSDFKTFCSCYAYQRLISDDYWLILIDHCIIAASCISGMRGFSDLP